MGPGGASQHQYGGQQAQSYDTAQEPHQRTAQEEEDDEVESSQAAKCDSQSRRVLASTRNALRIARETEETASGTLLKLGEQSDKLANTERHLGHGKSTRLSS